MLISFHYLREQSKSPAGYKAAKDALEDAKEKANSTEQDIALVGGLVTLGCACLAGFLLFGKYMLGEEKVVKVKEPVYINSAINNYNMSSKEPDYMSEISKNFIV